jgi:hypothetical protein
MTSQQEIDNDQAGFLNAMFKGGDPFHPDNFPEGKIRKQMQERWDVDQEFLKNHTPLESSRMLFLDTSDYDSNIPKI